MKTQSFEKQIMAMALALLLCPTAARVALAERVIYVNHTATGVDDGASWFDAYNELQDALDDAKVFGGCPCEIWVAAGTYKPDRGTGDQTLAFELASNIALYGGFAGDEECRDERDWIANESILSGDLDSNDDPGAEHTSNCCVTYEGCDDLVCREVVLAIMPGWCDVFWRSTCAGIAREYCCDICRPTRCDNSQNVVRAVGTDSTTALDGFIIQDGEAYAEQNTWGGGLYAYDSDLTVTRCTFRRNDAFGGVALTAFLGKPTITDSVFTANGSALTKTATVDVSPSEPITIRNCTVSDNRAGGLSARYIGTIEDCRFINNAEGGLMTSQYMELTGCSFVGNHRTALRAQRSVHLTDCQFLGNSEPSYGGGILMSSGSATLTNCVFAGNRAGNGEPDSGWAGAFKGSTTGFDRFTNCTFVNNSAGNVGGIWISNRAVLENCLLWGNSDDSGWLQHAQLSSSTGSSSIEVNHSIVQGWTGSFGGVGTFDADPLLAHPLGEDGVAGTEDDDLRLTPGSPAINAGNPSFVADPGASDLDGHARLLCGRVDIGAYEFGIGDFNCDRLVNLSDYVVWPACMTNPHQSPIHSFCAVFDFNADGDVDLADFAAFARAINE